jgi:serine/threonine protein kinase
MIGQTISHYRLLEKLGGGGMGVVYKPRSESVREAQSCRFFDHRGFDLPVQRRIANREWRSALH